MADRDNRPAITLSVPVVRCDTVCCTSTLAGEAHLGSLGENDLFDPR
jgi:hypothetical protein